MTTKPRQPGVIVEYPCQKRGVLVRLGPTPEPYHYVGTCHTCERVYRVSVLLWKGQKEGAS